jgi:hypothetical protein
VLLPVPDSNAATEMATMTQLEWGVFSEFTTQQMQHHTHLHKQVGQYIKQNHAAFLIYLYIYLKKNFLI